MNMCSALFCSAKPSLRDYEMLVIVGKATPNKATQTDNVELYLGQFRKMCQEQGQFVYAWSFNPDDDAIQVMRDYLNYQEDIFLYLPFDGRRANLRMHVKDFFHKRDGINMCPITWKSYCIPELQGYQYWDIGDIHLWFLIDAIEDLPQPVELLATFSPEFKDKYKTWGMNHFAFLRRK